MMKESVDLIIDYPSKIASMLLKDEIDIGLVPVAIIPKMKEYYIISDYCIGSEVKWQVFAYSVRFRWKKLKKYYWIIKAELL